VRIPGIPPRVAVLTVSDGVAAGTRQDASGATIQQWVQQHGFVLAAAVVVPDVQQLIADELLRLASDAAIDVIISTGGTGLTARDVTPEATREVITREAPGIAERVRLLGAQHTPFAALSRGVAGIREATLIVNLPGSTGGVRDGLLVLDEIIEHAVQLLRGVDTDRHDVGSRATGTP
jgi:molybdenum cofactor synthesis domain-containing protein